MVDPMPFHLGRVHQPDVRDNNFPMRDYIPRLTTRTRWYWAGMWFGDQGQTEECTAYSWTGFVMDGHTHDLSTVPLIAPDALYSEEQQIDGLQHGPLPDNDPNTGGSTVRAGAKVLTQRGLLSSYHWTFDATTLVRAVLTTSPVVVGTNWLENMFNPSTTGMLDVSGAVAGGHAYLVDGVNLAKGIVRIKNSWSKSWGIQGYAFMKISDLDTLIKTGGEACLPMGTDTMLPRTFDPNAASLEPE